MHQLMTNFLLLGHDQKTEISTKAQKYEFLDVGIMTSRISFPVKSDFFCNIVKSVMEALDHEYKT